MIEIRVNNDVIEYRTAMQRKAFSDLVEASTTWSEWQQAQEVPEAFKGMDHLFAPGPIGFVADGHGVKRPAVSANKLWMDYGDAWKQRAEHLAGGNAQMARRIAELIAERDLAQAAVNTWKSNSAKLEKENHKLNAELNALSTEVTRRNALHHDCSGQLRTALRERDELRATCGAAHESLMELQQRRITERTLLLRVLGLLGYMQPSSAWPKYSDIKALLDEIDAALKG